MNGKFSALKIAENYPTAGQYSWFIARLPTTLMRLAYFAGAT
jgi:hypothetical protein